MARRTKSSNRYTIGLAVAVLIIAVVMIVSFAGGSTGKFFYPSPTKTATYTYQPTYPVQMIPTQPIKIACTPAAEVCDGADNNCNNQIDENLLLYWHYIDSDHDGYGTNIAAIQNCNQAAPQGMINQNGDCNDNDNAINPAVPEMCNGVDDNCDGRSDEGFPTNAYYPDWDGDGYGGAVINACSVQAAQRQNGGNPVIVIGGDCNDNLANINPGMAEICGDAVDNNCNGQVDENCAGGQNAPACVPTAETCNSKDDDCDGVVDNGFDNDGDGYFFGAGCGLVYAQQDCNDNNAALYPGNGCP